jgi:hypothetical protein
MIGIHPDIAMHMEDFSHSKHPVVGTKVWGNKLCIPNHITLEPVRDTRTIWKRMEDGIRAVLGRPWWERSYPCPSHQHTIHNYLDAGAHLVAMIRDPDHAVDSMRRRGQIPAEEGKRRWSRAIRIIWQVHTEYEERTCLVRFLDLVSRPEETMRSICALLGLPYTDKMGEGYKHVPQYDYNRLDPSVATRDVQRYNLQNFDSEAYKMYEKMVADRC